MDENERAQRVNVELPPNFSPERVHVSAGHGVGPVTVVNETGKPFDVSFARAGFEPFCDARPNGAAPITISVEAYSVLMGVAMMWGAKAEGERADCARSLANTLGQMKVTDGSEATKGSETDSETDDSERLDALNEAVAEVLTLLAGFSDESRRRILTAAAALLGVLDDKG
jgi:hypothetical protein